MKWIETDQKLTQSRFKVFTDREFRAIAGVSPISAKFLLIRYTRQGLLCRLKRGLYAVKARMPSTWVIANRLYRPSYVSLSSALSYYGLIPETVYAVTSVTTKSTREFEARGVSYSYRTIKRSAFSGYRSVEINGESVLMAEKEKALADYLYFVFLKKEPWNRRLNTDGVHRGKLNACLELFDSPLFIKWFNREKHDLEIPDRRTAR
ncbi:MAG TPA: type IV toxin-antitoxin system AbiEi family antitoxin domain-containing protein [Elusimicrobiota bacterium]|nr:type IV toxin-antitoxin system AbiEi family antitoxin domain-containing protein [Elusimicrobiota bacterium]